MYVNHLIRLCHPIIMCTHPVCATESAGMVGCAESGS
jgi:hypothetical protein